MCVMYYLLSVYAKYSRYAKIMTPHGRAGGDYLGSFITVGSGWPSGMVQANVGQKRLKGNILRRFF